MRHPDSFDGVPCTVDRLERFEVLAIGPEEEWRNIDDPQRWGATRYSGPQAVLWQYGDFSH